MAEIKISALPVKERLSPGDWLPVITASGGKYKVKINLLQNKEVQPVPSGQVITPDEGYYGLNQVTVSPGVSIRVANNGGITPTGTYATSTYYDTAYGVKIGYMSNGDIILSMRGGTSTSYEYLYFALASAPDGVTLTAASKFTTSSYVSAAPGNIYACVISGVTRAVDISLNMSTVNSTYDYTRVDITITEV